jgi:hypothetical protein
MKKRYQSETPVTLTMFEVLDQKEYDILESTDKDLKKRIDALAKDIHIDWFVNKEGDKPICSISRTYAQGREINNNDEMDVSMAATRFLSAISEMELPKPEPECPSHESEAEQEEAQDVETVEFVKKLLNDINLPLENDHHVCSALIIVSYDLLKEMCELYLNNHK